MPKGFCKGLDGKGTSEKQRPRESREEDRRAKATPSSSEGESKERGSGVLSARWEAGGHQRLAPTLDIMYCPFSPHRSLDIYNGVHQKNTRNEIIFQKYTK